MSDFDNVERMTLLWEAFEKGNEEKMKEIIKERSYNSKLHKLLKTKNIQRVELKEDVVEKLTMPDTGDEVVVKTFDADEFPFHEICGNIISRHLLKKFPFFCKILDIGQSISTGEYLLIFEALEGDLEDSVDCDNHQSMFHMLFQLSFACQQLKKAANLLHFDLRFDNVFVETLDEPKDFFGHGMKTDFIVKIGDWGLCEFDFGGKRCRINEEIPRDDKENKKWGLFPRNYNGYDMQYFLGTLGPVLDRKEGQSYYYVFNMVRDLINPCTYSTSQDRPVEVTESSPMDICKFMKSNVLPSVVDLEPDHADKPESEDEESEEESEEESDEEEKATCSKKRKKNH